MAWNAFVFPARIKRSDPCLNGARVRVDPKPSHHVPQSRALLSTLSTSDRTERGFTDIAEIYTAVFTTLITRYHQTSSSSHPRDPLYTRVMATTMSASPAPSLAPADAEPFERHILALLTQFLEHPSPSYPFPTNAISSSSVGPDLPSYNGQKTQAQIAIESAIISLGERAAAADRKPSPQSGTNISRASLMTPDWTPIESADQRPSPQPITSDQSNTPTSNQPSFTDSINASDFGSNVSQISRSFTDTSVSAGWSKSPSQAGHMSAEKELALLRAQVQDIARVCKVSRVGSHSYGRLMSSRANFTGRRYGRFDTKDYRPRRRSGYDGIEGYHQLDGRSTTELCGRGGTSLCGSRHGRKIRRSGCC